MGADPHHPRPSPVPLARFAKYFLWLGTVGFGGPIALAGRMQQDLVDGRGWISQEDYVEGLAFAQLAPGPLAAQLAMYLGYVRAGILGSTLVGIAFVLPSFLMVLALSGGLRALRRAELDAGGFLRHWRRRHCHHRPLRP
jgi:chromate transporter